MTSGQKTALSLLLSVILFCAFSLAAFAGLFSAIDARFYEPAKIYGIRERLKNVALACDEYLSALGDRFATGESSFLKNPSVASFVEAKADQEDVFARSELLGDLRSSTQGFLGLRVLDKNQNSIHYSTFASDILRRDEKNNLTAYKNYLDCLSPSGKQEIPAQIISCEDTAGDLAAGKKVYFDADKRVVFSYPFYDRYSVFRGTALFYVNALDFSNALLKRGLISVGEGFTFLANGQTGQDSLCGYVFGIPSLGLSAQEEIENGVLDAWKNDSASVRRLFSIDAEDKNFLVALSERSKSGVFACGIFNDDIFSLSKAARFLILACVFVSLFLICFLILNLRRDDETVIRERIKTLQLGVVDEYLSKKEALDWEAISGRREAVTKEIISSLGGRAKKRQAQVEELINRSWDELFAAMNLRPAAGADSKGGLENAQEIKAMLQEILSSGAIKVQSVAAPSPAPVKAAPKPAAVEEVEASAAEPVEDLEEIPEAEEVADAEPVEDLEEVPEAEAVDVADAEPVEDLEEVPEAEEVEAADAEPVEDLEEIPEAEEVADAEPVEDLEEIPEAEAVEVADAEPVEDLEEVPEAETVDVAAAEPVEDLEEIPEAEAVDVDDAEPVEDLEEIPEAEAVEAADAEPVEDLEEIPDAEEVPEAEEVADAEPESDEDESPASSSVPEDIREDVASDFFAVHQDKEDRKEGEPHSRDNAFDPFFNVRDAFEPNEETESLAKNFVISEPNFKGLDTSGREQAVNGTFEEDKKNIEKEISLEEFGVQQQKEREEFSEDLEFGAPNAMNDDDGTDVASTFTTEKPRFERSPFAAFAKAAPQVKENKSAALLSDAEQDSASAAAAIPISGGKSFMFSSFGQNQNFSELQAADYSAIVQDSNGVFSITDDLQTGGFVQDNSFKRLVDSVLNKA
ncbi:MAG: hypothetical protein IKN82_00880 [Treponema sp.]|nr:hypothetical protein [Treponema sp.]